MTSLIIAWAVAIAIVMLAFATSIAIMIKAIKSAPPEPDDAGEPDPEQATVQSLNTDLNQLRTQRFGRSMWTTTKRVRKE